MITDEKMIVGIPGRHKSEVWFTPQFLLWLKRFGYFQVPGPKGVHYWIEGDRIIKARYPEYGNVIRVWVLTDQYRRNGRRLGVWPD